MLKLLKSYVAALSAVFMLASASMAGDSVIGLSPNGTPAERRAVIEKLAYYLGDTVNPGEKAYILDAANVRLLGTFTVPDKAAFTSARAKLRANGGALRALAEFAKNGNDFSGAGGHVGQIDLPAFLRHVGATYPAETPSDLIVVGSPLHDDTRAPLLSMMGGHVPNDGHIGSSRAQSPYGVAGERQRLANYNVYFSLMGSAWAVTPQHGYFVERYVALSISERGGALVSFSGDLPTVLQDARKSKTGVLGSYQIEDTEKLEMIGFAREIGDLGSIFERELSLDTPTSASLRRAEGLQIGISWDCACDLDLWVRPQAGAAVIYFAKPKSAEGRLLKDFVRSPVISNGLETVVFDVPVNLSEMLVAVNLFGGQPPTEAVAGQIRIAIGGHTWAKAFTIDAQSGNKGLGSAQVMADGNAPNAAWIVIDPVAVTGKR